MEAQGHNTSLGFFAGLLLGVLLPLFIFGGSIQGGKDTLIKESFYGGIVFGVLLDIVVVVSIILLFRH